VPGTKTAPQSENYEDCAGQMSKIHIYPPIRPFVCAQGRLYASTSLIDFTYTKLTTFLSSKIHDEIMHGFLIRLCRNAELVYFCSYARCSRATGHEPQLFNHLRRRVEKAGSKSSHFYELLLIFPRFFGYFSCLSCLCSAN